MARDHLYQQSIFLHFSPGHLSLKELRRRLVLEVVEVMEVMVDMEVGGRCKHVSGGCITIASTCRGVILLLGSVTRHCFIRCTITLFFFSSPSSKGIPV